MTEHSQYRRSAQLMEAELGEELVALDAERGMCFGFSDVATFVWRSLDQPRTFEQMKDELVAAYDVDEAVCERELRELLDRLQELGLLSTAAK